MKGQKVLTAMLDGCDLGLVSPFEVFFLESVLLSRLILVEVFLKVKAGPDSANPRRVCRSRTPPYRISTQNYIAPKSPRYSFSFRPSVVVGVKCHSG